MVVIKATTTIKRAILEESKRQRKVVAGLTDGLVMFVARIGRDSACCTMSRQRKSTVWLKPFSHACHLSQEVLVMPDHVLSHPVPRGAEKSAQPLGHRQGSLNIAAHTESCFVSHDFTCFWEGWVSIRANLILPVDKSQSLSLSLHSFHVDVITEERMTDD